MIEGNSARLGPVVLAIAAIAFGQHSVAAESIDVGKTAFENQCSICHTTVVGKNGLGPSLAEVLGRRSGSLPDYNYSSAIANAGLIWNVTTLDDFLAASTVKVPGTVMSISIADVSTRNNIIGYLAMIGTAGADAITAAVPSATPLDRGPTGEELLQASTDSRIWLYASKGCEGQRYVPSKQITANNAARLRPVCIYRSDAIASMQSSLSVYRDTMYLAMNETTVAINAATYRPRWTYIWKMKDGALSKNNRGVALKDGRLIRGRPDGYLVAINMIYEDRIIYGPAGADWGAKNWIGAFDLRTGEEKWRFNLVPVADEPGAESWTNPVARDHGGGSLWTPVALDVTKGILYVPVGNPPPDFYEAARPGDNVYTDSAVALDFYTRKLLSFHQFVAADEHDRDLGQVRLLFRESVNGRLRDLMAISGKDGSLRVLDRDSHEQLYEIPITSRADWNAAPTGQGTHSCPALLGGMEWNGPAYSRATRALYVATVDWCATFMKTPQPPQFTLIPHNYGGAAAPDPFPAAFPPMTQRTDRGDGH